MWDFLWVCDCSKTGFSRGLAMAPWSGKEIRQWLRRERGAVAEDRERQSRVYLSRDCGQKKKTKRWDLTPFGLGR